MSEQSVDNTISYTQKSGWKMLAFLCVFVIAGAISIVKFDSYFTDFWKIRKCNPEGYERGDFMTSCAGIKVDRYAFGSIYLGSQKNAVKNAKAADVIVFGNSRTMRSFSTDAIDNYFKSKGLTYVIFAVEGASYASAKHTVEKLGLKPKIVMTNTEILYSDVVGEAFGDLVYFPDKYKTRFDFFHAAQSFQKWICGGNIGFLKDIYCQGRTGAGWRSAVTGRFKWELVAEPEKNIPFTARDEQDPPSRRMNQILPNAEKFLGMSEFKNSCQVLYLVNSPSSEPKLMKSIGDLFEIDTVYAEGRDFKSYDKSHLDRPTSEAWGSEFVKYLDGPIDRCLDGGGQPNFENLEAYFKASAEKQAALDAQRQKALDLREQSKKDLQDRLEAREERKERAAQLLQERLEERQQAVEEKRAARDAQRQKALDLREQRKQDLLDRLEARKQRDKKSAQILQKRKEAIEAREKARVEALEPKGPSYSDNPSDTMGTSNFESWDISGDTQVLDKSAKAPDGSSDADVIIANTSTARLRYIFKDQPIKAGMTMTFGGWFWTDSQETSVRLQIVRSCSPKSPVESASLNSRLNSEPHRLEVQHTFKHGHECALVQIVGIGDAAKIKAWQGRVEFSEFNSD